MFLPFLPIASPLSLVAISTMARVFSPFVEITIFLTIAGWNRFLMNSLGSSEYSITSTCLPICFFTLFMLLPFLPIAKPMSPLLTTNTMRLSSPSRTRQSLACAPVSDSKSAIYLIVSVVNETSGTLYTSGQCHDVRVARLQDCERRDDKRLTAYRPQIYAQPRELINGYFAFRDLLLYIGWTVGGHNDKFRYSAFTCFDGLFGPDQDLAGPHNASQ